MKKIFKLFICIALFFVTLIFICVGCGVVRSQSQEGFVTIDKKQYEYRDAKDGSIYLSTDEGEMNICTMSKENFAMYFKSDDHTDYEIDVPIESAEQAASVGGSILNDTYEDWTEAGIVVYYNEEERLWIVLGERVSRDSNQQHIGLLVVDNTNGSVVVLQLL